MTDKGKIVQKENSTRIEGSVANMGVPLSEATWREGWDYKRVGPNSEYVIAHAVGPQYTCVGEALGGDRRYLQPNKVTMEKIFADARLIAAAPVLLAALTFVSTDPCFHLLGSLTHDEVKAAINSVAEAS